MLYNYTLLHNQNLTSILKFQKKIQIINILYMFFNLGTKFNQAYVTEYLYKADEDCPVCKSPLKIEDVYPYTVISCNYCDWSVTV